MKFIEPPYVYKAVAPLGHKNNSANRLINYINREIARVINSKDDETICKMFKINLFTFCFKHYQKLFLVVIFFSTLMSACGQKNESEDSSGNHYGLIYAMDVNRRNVADSLKYLIPILDSIMESDQKYRYGSGSNLIGKEAQMKAMARFNQHKKEVLHIDSINVKKISTILDKYGWLGKKQVGLIESRAFFFVIQHADSATQDKYLPLVREAAKNKIESPHHLSLLEDRVSLRKNKYQLYGTQTFYYPPNKRYYLFPINDPENIIKRRNEIGLDSLSLSKYLNGFDIVWDLETYKKELPVIKEYIRNRNPHK